MIERSTIINSIIIKYKLRNYLEIGVWVPQHNYDKIRVEAKESVDPRQGFIYTHNVTSDEFFAKRAINKKWDIIFIDALHTEKQSYIDAKNALNHLTEEGFLIMHDCKPEEEWHTRKLEEDPAPGPIWTGLVYKSFIRLKNELKNYSCFVINEDWGCGVITKRPLLKNNSKGFDQHMAWKEFHENKAEVLQLISYEEFLKL